MKLSRNTLSIGLASLATLSTGAVSAADIVIGVPNWPSVAATAQILKLVIEENFGLEVELQNGTNPIVFEAMDKGSMHVHPEVWLPNQENLHNTYVKENGTVVMNENPVLAEQGMCVPSYVAEEMGITSIDDLTDPDKAGIFDADGDGTPEVYIGAPGWASTIVEQVRAKSYGYDTVFDLQQYDETLAYSNLANAINAKEPWVGFCYTPHYIFVAHDIVMLEEPPHDAESWNVVQPTDDPAWLEKSEAGSAWNSATLHLHYAAALKESHPEVAALFDAFAIDGDSLSDMGLALSVNGQEAADYAAEWVAKHEDTVIDWLTQ